MSNSYWKEWYGKNKKHFLETVNKHKKKRRKEFRVLIDEKKNVACKKCSNTFPPEAMDLFFRNVEDKLFRISDATRLIYSIKKLMDQLAMCDVYCANCAREKHMKKFLKENVGSGKSRLRRRVLRELVDAFKNKPCPDCKNMFPPYCMELDHLGKHPKEGTVARMVSEGKPIEIIEKEMSKTEPVCLCCHRIRTKKRGYQSN